MKKNISINIFGTIYAIDEDAYQLLDNYINGMKNYFRSEEGGEEIADDIEHRVAELLWEEKEKGMEAVSIETVKAIINKIGNAAEIDANGDANNSNSSSNENANNADNQGYMDENASAFDRMKAHMRSRRLYRNGKNKVLGGVCAGLAEYFGGMDVTIWRLITILLCVLLMSANFAGSLIPILYIILWVIVPEAKTHEDWLRMKGEEVNAENIKKQIVNETESSQQQGGSHENHGGGCLRVLITVVAVIALLPMAGIFFGIMVSMFAMVMSGIGLVALPWSEFDPRLTASFMAADIKPLVWMALVAGIITIGLPLYAIVRGLWNKGKSMASSAKVTMVVVWLLALVALIYAITTACIKFNASYDKEREKELTRNGIMLGSRSDWAGIDDLGWNMERIENVKPHIIQPRTGFGGMPKMALRLQRDNSALPMTIKMSKEEYYDEGCYVLETLSDVAANGAKVCLYAAPDSTLMASIALSKDGERLDTMSWARGKSLPVFFTPDSAQWNSFAHKGDRWIYQISKPFQHKGGNIILTLDVDNQSIPKVKVRTIQIRKLETEEKQK